MKTLGLLCLVVTLNLAGGCATTHAPGDLRAIKADAWLDCYKDAERQCMNWMGNEDAECGFFCEVVHSNQPDWAICLQVATMHCNDRARSLR